MDERFVFYFLKGILFSFVLYYIAQIIEFTCSVLISWRLLFHKNNEDAENCNAVVKSQGVTIIKPLMGLDASLVENLESHFTITYPAFEILCCFHTDTDPAIAVVKSLMNKYPHVDCQIFISDYHNVTNPLIQNMLPAYNNAKYDLLWISTSRIKATTDILIDMIIKLQQENVGLVHQMPYINTPNIEHTWFQSLLQIVEKIYFGSCLAKHFLAADALNIGLFCGMSYLTKKSILEKFGGFPELGKFLAEDYFLQKLIEARGMKTRLSTYPAQQNMLTKSLDVYKDRLVRWTRLRLQLAPFVTLFLEPITNSLAQAIIISLALHNLFNIHPIFFLPGHFALWILLDLKLVEGVEGKHLDSPLWMFLCAWVIRELMVFYVLFEALLNPFIINWGRGTYRVTCGGHTEKLHRTSIVNT